MVGHLVKTPTAAMCVKGTNKTEVRQCIQDSGRELPIQSSHESCRNDKLVPSLTTAQNPNSGVEGLADHANILGLAVKLFSEVNIFLDTLIQKYFL